MLSTAEHCRSRQCYAGSPGMDAQRASRMRPQPLTTEANPRANEAALEWPTCNAPRLLLMPGAAGGICSATHPLHGCSIPFA